MATFVIRHCETDMFVEMATIDIVTHVHDIDSAMMLDEESAIAIANLAESVTDEDYEVMEINT